MRKEVTDALGRPVNSEYYASEDGRGFVELSRASGLGSLTLEERNPMKATSYGTGQLIADCLERGLKRVNVLVGGSATNEGGIGCAGALGFTFLDRNGTELAPTGENLVKVRRIGHRDP